MLKNLISKVTGGDAGDKQIRPFLALLDETNALEPDFEALSDAQLRARTDEFRARIHEQTAGAVTRLADVRRRLDLAMGEADSARRAELQDELKRRQKELFQAENEALDDLLPEAFAAVREAAKRAIGQRHFDVQLVGGAVLHSGKIAEMRTGEGKTLVATLPAYVNALLGHGVHVVTVNDYLARRDAAWMGAIYHKLGMSVGVLQGEGDSYMFEPGYDQGRFPNLRPVRTRSVTYYTARGETVRELSDRGEAYQADITYGTNNEFGFDYLRDNLAYNMEDRVQRELYYAIVDEVDNIFIDEARTPLIISGFADEDVEEYRRWAQIVRKLESGADYTVHEKERNVELTTHGLARVEELAGLSNIYDDANQKYVHHLDNALSAQALFLKGREYIVQHNQVVLVDEHTGRLMADRRLSDGLHQAIEAKEAVKEIRPRMVTQATITIQNYFRMYKKLCGMSGTAKSEQEEFYKIYGLDVMVIPTNVEYMAMRPDSGLQESRRKVDGVEQVVYTRRGESRPTLFRRTDYPDQIYRTTEAKWQAIVDELARLHQSGRPVLIGTTSVEKSEELGRRLRAAGVPHQILNAKYHAEEAAIIARAGELHAVTVATNMAGRGVDIRLGGELKEETIREAQARLRRRGLDPFRVSDDQFYSAIAEVDPEYVRRRNQVLALGGLHVLGTERHDARRIDNQLRGRAGRQGEPGSSRFYVSLEDDMMRVFAADRIDGLMKWAMGGDDSLPLEHSAVTKALDTTQSRVEGFHFDTRKHVLEYDDVLNRQRDIIYGQRMRVLTKDDVHEDVWQLIEEELDLRLGARGAKGRKGQGAPESDVFTWLESIMPVAYTPSSATWTYPFHSAPGLPNVLPPFSIWFSANRLEGNRGLELSRALTGLVDQSLTGYRDEIIARAIETPLDEFFAREKSGLDELGAQLEEKAEEYILWQEEQEKPLQGRAFAEHLKRVFPPFKNAPFAEIQATTAERARRELAPQLERAYYHQTTLDLLNRVYQASQAFRSDWVTPPEAADDLQALAEQAHDGSENARAQKELERLLADLQKSAEGGGKLARSNVFEVLVQIAALGDVPLAPLGDLLRSVVTTSCDRWAVHQRQETAAVLDAAMTQVREGTRDEIAQMLLDTLYVLRQGVDARHQKVVYYAPRFPLPAMAEAIAAGLSGDELRDAIYEVLDEAVELREDIWGRAEHARLSALGVTLGALEEPALESLERFWGQALLDDHEDTRVAELPADAQDALRTWLALRAIEDRRVIDLPDSAALLEYLARRVAADFGERWHEQDELTRQDVENVLRASGAFEDPGAEEQLLGQTLDALKPAFVEGLAVRLGKAELDPQRFAPVSDLPAPLRDALRAMLVQRGVFNDEKRVQNFLVEQQLTDLGEPSARETVRRVAAARLARMGGYRISELDERLQGWWQAALRDSGALTDPARRARLLSTPIGQLDEPARRAIAEGLGQALLAGCVRAGDLPEALQTRVAAYLARAGQLGPLPVAALGPEVAGRVRAALLAEARAALDAHPAGELPEWLRALVYVYLEEREYFVDRGRAREIAAQPLGQLDTRVLAGLEQCLGDELIAPLADRTLQALDEDARAALLRFFDTRGLFRKKDQRQRLLATRVADLALLEKGLYADVAAHLGREKLNPVRNTRTGELTGELGQKVQAYLRRSGTIEDADRREVVALLPVAELEADVRAGLDQALARAFDAWLERTPLNDLPPVVLALVDAALAAAVPALSGEPLAALRTLELAALPPEQLAGLRRALGQAELPAYDDRPLVALDGGDPAAANPPAGGRAGAAWQALEAGGLLLDEARQAQSSGRTLDELAHLAPAAHAAVVAALADWLYNEAATRRVAELDDDLRRDLREALDEQQQFVDAQAVRNFDNGRLADLRAPDYEAAVSTAGRRSLEALPDRQAPLRTWPDDLRMAALAHARAQGLTLDEERLRAFRERGPQTLDAAQARLLEYTRETVRRAVATRSIAELDEGLRRYIETYLEEHDAGGGGAQELARLGNQRLGQLDPDLLGGLAGFWGRRRVTQLSGHTLAQMDEDTGASLAEFFGRRMRQSVEKALMLTHISRLWIDYLTEIESLRQGIGLQAFGQRDPLVEYKRRAFQLFDELRADIRRSVVGDLFALAVPRPITIRSG
jgi:preprotein translocase subunit SecA